MASGTWSPVGGAVLSGTAPVTFTPGAVEAVTGDVVLEWDFDGDGDFDETVEDVTSLMVSVDTLTGRDWPSSLTGKAAAGQMKVLLLNSDDRFSHFNTASPLNADPFSLALGRKIRLRTAAAANPDPTVLAHDRFLGAAALTVDEVGNAWTAQSAVFGQAADSTGATMAVPDQLGATHIATVDVGAAEYAMQLQWRHLDYSNEIGLVYAFDDTSNYGLVSMIPLNNTVTVAHVEVVSGTPTVTDSVQVEYRADDFLGLAVADGVVTVLHNGVALFTDTAVSSASTEVGMYAKWVMQRPPSVQEFHVWDALPVETPGVLWTGYVSAINPTVALGPEKFAEVTADGPLATAAGVDINAPNTVGILSTTARGRYSPGSTTGQMVGAALGRAGLLHPGGPIAEGVVRCGSSAHKDGPALPVMRDYEEAEIGFLHETPEGWIGFEGRGDRAAKSVDAWFGDHDTEPFGFRRVALLDWRSQIYNRVESRVAPKCPVVMGFTGENTAATEVIVPMPDAVNGALPGDLFLIVIASSVAEPGVSWITPPGWTSYRNANDQSGKLRIFAKLVGPDDIDADVTFLSISSPMGAGDFVSFNYLIKDWYGDLQKGLAVSDVHGYGHPYSTARAQAGDNDPPAVFPDWGPGPSATIVIRAGMTTSATMDVDVHTDATYVPHGFSDLTVNASAVDCAMEAASRNANDEVIDPTPFLTDAGAGAAFGGLDQVETVTIAIRGYAGDTPQVSGGEIVRTDDTASQERHKVVRTYTAASQLFADRPDAEAYNAEILARFSSDRPVLEIEFPATISAAYMEQATERRVSDRVRLTADGVTGMGIDAEFHIENIGHRISNAGKVWNVVWQLSPA